MVPSYDDTFEVTWQDPEDAKDTWRLDTVHWPLAQPRLCQDILTSVIQRGIEWDVVWVNHYMYVRRLGAPDPTPEVLERGPSDVWFNDYQPLVRSTSHEIRTTDYDALSTEQVAAAVPAVAAKAGDAFWYTTVVVKEMWAPAFALMDFCEKELGEQGSSLATTIMQGVSNESSNAGQRLERLAEEAERHPDVSLPLRAGDFALVLSLDQSHPFRQMLDEYLHEFGGRLESWSHLHRPTWRENPALALMLLQRQLLAPGSSATAAIQQSVEGRQQARAAVEALLPAEKHEEFNTLVAKVADYVTLSEDRAYWQLTLMGNLRIAVGVLAGRLASSGVIDQADDVWHLTLAEIREASADPSKRYHGLVSERRAEYERWAKAQPPGHIGAAPGPWSPEIEKVMVRFRGAVGAGLPVGDARTIKGQAASAGVARGRARILRSLEESHRVEAGDILVCTMTSPPWTPLFATAGGVVTDFGGVLSHSAICAREYGIPCVVGTQVATTTIPDGATITVDGSRGTVVIDL